MIAIRHIAKSFHASPFAVRDVSLDVASGEFVVILGESGSGKTTTLKIINRLVEPSSGTITIDGKDTLSMDPVVLRRSIGYVVQGIGLFPHMTVAENIGVVPRLLGWDRAAIAQRTEELMHLTGLEYPAFRDRKPDQLSGGQRQRVGFARALAASPGIMLMDEPFGALDPITRDTLQQEFRALQQRLGLTVIMVTHDVTEALLMADRIAVMEQGTIVETGTPRQLVAGPVHPYASALFETPRRQAEQIESLLSQEPR